ncbi:hypothetical protein ACFL59_04315 [Planctomycetota bacterium]
MQAICPECYAVYESRTPVTGNRLRCRKCKAEFLLPAQRMLERVELAKQGAVQSKEDLSLARARLKELLREERWELQKGYRKAEERLEQSYQEGLQQRMRAEEEVLGSSVRKPLANKLLKIVLTIYFIVVVLVNLAFMGHQYITARNDVVANLESSERIFGEGLSEALWSLHKGATTAIVRGMLEHPLIVGVRVVDDMAEEMSAGGLILDAAGKPVFRALQGGEEPQDHQRGARPTPDEPRARSASQLFSHSFPVTYVSEDGTETVVGRVTVHSSTSFVFDRVKGGYYLLVLNALVVALALAITLLWASRKFLGRPLSALTNALAELNMDNLDSLEVHVSSPDRDELKVLEQSFNGMVRNLVEEKRTIVEMAKTFERFVPRQLLQRIADEGVRTIAAGRMQRDRLAVLYAEAHGHDPEAEGTDPEKELRFSCAYLASMEAPIEKHGGFIYRFSTRTVLALFALDDRSTEALSAVYAAIDMQKALAAFNEKQAAHGHPRLSLGVGIHSGEVILGTLGTEAHMEPLAMGEGIEVAIRLQELTRETGAAIVVSAEIQRLSESYDAYQCAALEGAACKGKEGPVPAFRVVPADTGEGQTESGEKSAG